jgi:hypothetical protein
MPDAIVEFIRTKDLLYVLMQDVIALSQERIIVRNIKDQTMQVSQQLFDFLTTGYRLLVNLDGTSFSLLSIVGGASHIHSVSFKRK